MHLIKPASTLRMLEKGVACIYVVGRSVTAIKDLTGGNVAVT